MDSLGRALHQQSLSTPKVDPYSAIRQAARETGADFDYLYRTARRESSLNPEARAATSSATGLFQFTDDTWLRMVNRYGEKYGMASEAEAVTVARGEVTVADAGVRESILDMRRDPVMAARMAGELSLENANIMEASIGRKPTPHELYAAHFMGPSGAARLINAVRDDGTLPAAQLFSREARANPAIFNTASGEPRSVAAVYARLTGDSLREVDQGRNVAMAQAPDAKKNHVALAQVELAPESPLEGRGRSGAARLTTSLFMALLDLQKAPDTDADGSR